MKKLIFATFAMLLFMGSFSACTDTADNDDQNYEQSTDKPKIKRPGDGD